MSELKGGLFVAAQVAVGVGRRPAAWFQAASRSGLYTLPQHRAAGQLGRTPHCLEPTPTPAAAAKRFLFAAGAGLLSAARGRPTADPRIALDHRGTNQPPPPAAAPDDARRIRHLMFYFGMVSWSKASARPTASSRNRSSTTSRRSILDAGPGHRHAHGIKFPWIIKPIYGLVSDFVPFFGYRRKSYLSLADLVTTSAYLVAAHMEAPSRLLFVLLLTAYAMAIASACAARSSSRTASATPPAVQS